MTLRRFILAVLAGIVVTVVLGLIAGIMSGGGHNMIPIIVVFPYMTYLIFGMQVEQVPSYFGIFLFFIQFVVYAVLSANARDKRQVIYIAVAVLIVHAAAVAFSYSAYNASERADHFQNALQ